MDQDEKVVLLKTAVAEGEAASGRNSSSERSEPVDVQPPSDERALPVGALAKKLSEQETRATDPLAALKQALEAPQGAGGVRDAPVPEIKVPPRDSLVHRAEPPRNRKLRLMAGACAVLVLGWFVGLSTPSMGLDQATNWMHQGVSVVKATFGLLGKELEDRLAQLTNGNASVVEASQTAAPERPNSTDALQQVLQALPIKLDQIHASTEGATRDLRADVERLRASVEHNQAELTSKLAQVVERIERMEQPKASPPVAAVAQKPEQVAALAPTPPSTVQRPALGAGVKPSPSPAAPELRREPTIIKQWTVREVLNGMALLEGPRGLVGVSPGQTVPGVGRVETITRQGTRWVVATSNGVITGR